MNIDLYERIWMWATGIMLAVFFGSLARGALSGNMHPPSHIETINPSTVMQDPRFTPAGQGVRVEGDRIHVWAVGLMFTWMPAELTLPAGRPVTFHLTSIDVIHGYQIVRTNGQVMVVPGYVSQFTTQFDAGEYLIACNEYCGLGHHNMAGKLTVVPADQWTPPPTATTALANPVPAEGASHEGH